MYIIRNNVDLSNNQEEEYKKLVISNNLLKSILKPIIEVEEKVNVEDLIRQKHIEVKCNRFKHLLNIEKHKNEKLKKEKQQLQNKLIKKISHKTTQTETDIIDIEKEAQEIVDDIFDEVMNAPINIKQPKVTLCKELIDYLDTLDKK